MKKHKHIKTVSELKPEEKEKLYRQLGGLSALGFHKYYFDDLPYHKTKTDCFHHVNELYYELFGEYRYSSSYSFRNQQNKHIKSK